MHTMYSMHAKSLTAGWPRIGIGAIVAIRATIPTGIGAMDGGLIAPNSAASPKRFAPVAWLCVYKCRSLPSSTIVGTRIMRSTLAKMPLMLVLKHIMRTAIGVC